MRHCHKESTAVRNTDLPEEDEREVEFERAVQWTEVRGEAAVSGRGGLVLAGDLRPAVRDAVEEEITARRLHAADLEQEGRKCFIYGYMVSDIWLRTILIVRKETRCRYMGYSLGLTARVLLYAPFHRQDSTYHGLCYTSRGALAGTRNSSMGPPHEGSIRRPIAP